MLAERFVPSPQHLDLLDRVARSVARARRLSADDTEDFAQTVHVRMAERNYEPLRKFEGRASLRTYLTVVLTRQLKDWQNHHYGKWRPCAAAQRLGKVGEVLDREMNRDGHSTTEAVRMVSSRTGLAEREVHRLAEQVPRRSRRRRVDLDAAIHHSVPFTDPIAAAQRARALRLARGVIVDALGALPPAEARLFLRRYLVSCSVADLAREEGHEQKGLYRRFERIRRVLHAHVTAQGLAPASLA